MRTMLIVFFIIATLIVLFTMFKSGKFIKNLFKTLIQGIVSLMAVNVIGLITGVTIAVNWYTLLTVSLFGIPASIAIVLLDAFLI